MNFNNSDYCPWKELKSYCFSIIRGKLLPIQFRIVFQLSPAQYSLLFADSSFQISTDQIRGLNLNLQYKNNELFCTTGISSDTFLLDRHPEITWDSAVPKFFKNIDWILTGCKILFGFLNCIFCIQFCLDEIICQHIYKLTVCRSVAKRITLRFDPSFSLLAVQHTLMTVRISCSILTGVDLNFFARYG